jgi:hypothetical protein
MSNSLENTHFELTKLSKLTISTILLFLTFSQVDTCQISISKQVVYDQFLIYCYNGKCCYNNRLTVDKNDQNCVCSKVDPGIGYFQCNLEKSRKFINKVVLATSGLSFIPGVGFGVLSGSILAGISLNVLPFYLDVLTQCPSIPSFVVDECKLSCNENNICGSDPILSVPCESSGNSPNDFSKIISTNTKSSHIINDNEITIMNNTSFTYITDDLVILTIDDLNVIPGDFVRVTIHNNMTIDDVFNLISNDSSSLWKTQLKYFMLMISLLYIIIL